MTKNIRALVIGDVQRFAVRELVAKASAAVVPLFEVKRLARTPGARPPAVSREQTIELPFGYSVTYTHEEQPGAVCRHLSVSVDGPGALPSPEAVEEIMKLFGFAKPRISEAVVWLEDIGDTEAVNVVQPLDGDMESLRRASG